MIQSVAGRMGASAEPHRVSSALLLASLVTLAAVIPLAVLALRGDDDGPVASTQGLVVTIADATTDLSGAVLQPGVDAAISIDGDDLIAAAWSLQTPDGFLLAEGRAVGAPPYQVELPPGLVAGLDPGLYDLLATVTLEDGATDRRAARFAVEDG